MSISPPQQRTPHDPRPAVPLPYGPAQHAALYAAAPDGPTVSLSDTPTGPVLHSFARAIRRRLPLVLGTWAGCVGAGAAYLVAARPTYHAVTAIRIDQRQAGVPVLDFFLKELSASDVFTEQATLGSRALVEAVTDSLGLQLEVRRPARLARAGVFSSVRVDRAAPGGDYTLSYTPAGVVVKNDTSGRTFGPFKAGAPVAAEGVTLVLTPRTADAAAGDVRYRVRRFPEAVERVRKAVKVERPDRDANVIVLNYADHDSVLVRDVPNAIAARFIDDRRAVQKSVARGTATFLRAQLDTVAGQLSHAEDAVRDYRTGRQAVDLPTEGTARVNHLAELEAERNQLRAERDALGALVADAQRDAAAGPTGAPSPYRRLVGFPTLFRNQTVAELLRSLGVAEDQRAALLNRRTLDDQDVRVLTRRIGEIEQQVQSVVTTYLQGLTRQVAALDAELSSSGRELAALPARERDLARLERQPKLLAESFGVLQTRLRDAQIAEAVEDPSVRIIDPAVTPTMPASPKPVLVLTAAALLGTFGGTGLAWWRERAARGVQTRAQLLAATGAPVLGIIPRQVVARGARGSSPADQVKARRSLLLQPRGWDPALEAYRSLRTNLVLGSGARGLRSVVVTSALPGDGKSMTAANLAVLMAWQGLSVAVVDADLRRGALGALFRTGSGPGLAEVLRGRAALAEATRPIALDGPGPAGTTVLLDVVPAGAPGMDPAELLGSPAWSAALRVLVADHDLVIIDSPPLAVVADAAVLAQHADGALLVARSGVTPAAALARAAEQLRGVAANVVGAVLTDADDAHEADGYGATPWRAQYQAYAAAG